MFVCYVSENWSFPSLFLTIIARWRSFLSRSPVETFTTSTDSFSSPHHHPHHLISSPSVAYKSSGITYPPIYLWSLFQQKKVRILSTKYESIIMKQPHQCSKVVIQTSLHHPRDAETRDQEPELTISCQRMWGNSEENLFHSWNRQVPFFFQFNLRMKIFFSILPLCLSSTWYLNSIPLSFFSM